MSLELITMKELLRDPQYRAYFKKIPKLPPHYSSDNLPWKLLILKPGEKAWRSKRFGTYKEAFAAMKKLMPTIENAAINCVPLNFMPPIRNVRVKGKFVTVRGKQKPMIATRVWRPQLAGDMAHHDWCGHCRRPSIFVTAAININRKDNKYSMPVGEVANRCIICGASERVMDLRHPENNQKWDASRDKVMGALL